MPPSLEKVFVDFDLFYPTSNTGFTAWGKQGVALLNQIKSVVNERLKELAYSQIFLPSVFTKSYYQRYIGDEKKNNLLVNALFNQEEALVLKPFSELIYADFLSRNFLGSDKYSDYQKAFQWGLCFLNEIHPNLCLNCNEITKCEIFSMHDDYGTAEATWNDLNHCLGKVCLEDFRVHPLFGYRPGVSAFPSSRDTFAAELNQGESSFQTLLVSHIMQNDFLSRCGFGELARKVLCSACFSQKMIGAVILHHLDSYGVRYPYRLAPTLGIIISPDLSKDQINQPRVKISLSNPHPDGKTFMVKEGAIWLIEEVRERDRSSKWLLFQRGNPDSAPVEMDTFASAYQKAQLDLQNYDQQLLEESREKVLGSMLRINTYNQCQDERINQVGGAKPNIFVPCCSKNDCQNSVYRKIGWIPKLIYQEVPGICIECGVDTTQGIMFEQQEMYTSFYVPKERCK